MTGKLDGLNWRPSWMSQMGCIAGCSDYLGAGKSLSWLFGASGMAFVLNIAADLCPSGPTSWRRDRMFKLLENCGLQHKSVSGIKQEKDFAEKQAFAWDWVRRAIDAGIPCYGWELGIPEYAVIMGYDGDDYLWQGPPPPIETHRKPWRELGVSEISVLEVHFIGKCDSADAAKTIQDAVEFSLQFSTSPAAWVFPEYKSGDDGYLLWETALREGSANQWGAGYNAACWAECRHHAAQFLAEAAERVGEGGKQLLMEASRIYSEVARILAQVCEQFPFGETGAVSDKSRLTAGAGLIVKAREAEASGREKLAQFVSAARSTTRSSL